MRATTIVFSLGEFSEVPLYNTALTLFDMKATTIVLSLGVYKETLEVPLYNTALTLIDMKATTIVSSLGVYKESPDRVALPFSMSPISFQA